MNNPINLAIGVAVLCCSFSCATSFMNTGLGDIFGGAGGLVTGAEMQLEMQPLLRLMRSQGVLTFRRYLQIKNVN